MNLIGALCIPRITITIGPPTRSARYLRRLLLLASATMFSPRSSSWNTITYFLSKLLNCQKLYNNWIMTFYSGYRVYFFFLCQSTVHCIVVLLFFLYCCAVSNRSDQNCKLTFYETDTKPNTPVRVGVPLQLWWFRFTFLSVHFLHFVFVKLKGLKKSQVENT